MQCAITTGDVFNRLLLWPLRRLCRAGCDINAAVDSHAKVVVAAFVESSDLGTRLLTICQVEPPYALDADTMTGNLLRICTRHATLAAPPVASGVPPRVTTARQPVFFVSDFNLACAFFLLHLNSRLGCKLLLNAACRADFRWNKQAREQLSDLATQLNTCDGVGRTGEAVDMQSAVISETALLVQPVSTMAARLAQLLEEWPDHPILLQLQAICHRLLGACQHALLAFHRARDCSAGFDCFAVRNLCA